MNQTHLANEVLTAACLCFASSRTSYGSLGSATYSPDSCSTSSINVDLAEVDVHSISFGALLRFGGYRNIIIRAREPGGVEWVYAIRSEIKSSSRHSDECLVQEMDDERRVARMTVPCDRAATALEFR